MRKPIMCRDRQTLGFCLRQNGIGSDDADRGIAVLGLAEIELGEDLTGPGRDSRRQAKPAKFVADFKTCRPEMLCVAPGDRAQRVDGNQRANGDTARQDAGGLAKPALEPRRQGASASTMRAGFKHIPG